MLILPRLSHFQILDSFCFSTNWDYADTIATISHSGAIDELRIDLSIPPNYETDVLFRRFPALTDIGISHRVPTFPDQPSTRTLVEQFFWSSDVFYARLHRDRSNFCWMWFHRRAQFGYKTRAQVVCDAKMLAEDHNGEEAQLIKHSNGSDF